MTNEINDSTNLNSSLIISAEMESHLKKSAKWSYFLSIVGFVFILFLLIIGIVMFGLSKVKNEYSDFQNLPFAFPFVFIGIMYFIMAVLYFFPTLYLFKFGSKIISAFEMNDQTALNVGLKNLKQMFVFIGILTIIALSFSILTILLSFIFKGMMGSL